MALRTDTVDPMRTSEETEVETYECEYIDPHGDEECGADGDIFRVALVAEDATKQRDPLLVCPTHLPAVMGEPMRLDPVWAVALAQEVAR